jgi:Flp pilus assembly pilin Flp
MPATKDETGQTSVEYVLILALVALVCIVALRGLIVPFDHLATQIADKVAGAL